MFKQRGQAGSEPGQLSYDYDDRLPPTTRKESEESEGEQYKGRTAMRRLSDGVRKLSTAIDSSQRHAKVQMEVDLHYVALVSMRTEIPFANKKGWLWKCRYKGDRWLRRFFIIQGQLVVYFTNENDSKPKGAFLLHSYANVDYPKESINGRIYNLDLDTPERTYYLSAETAEEAFEWGMAFADACGESHRALYAEKRDSQMEAENKAEQLQKELSRVLVERDGEIKQAVDSQKKTIEQEAVKTISQVKVEVESMREDVIQARDQLHQWQHLAENLLRTIQSQDMFLSEEQKEKLTRMNENFQNLSELLRMLHK